MAITPHLGLTLVEQAQAQKEVTVNMALMRIDALLNSSVVDKDLTAPPSVPAEGDVYIVASPATEEWAGQENAIAYFEQVWRFITPNEGMMFWVQGEGMFYVFDGSNWVASGSGGGEGEANTGVNANGDAGGVFKNKSASSLVFNNIVAGSNVSVSGGGASGGDIVISASGDGGGGVMALTGLSDVGLSTVSDGEVLTYDATSGEWVNHTLAEAGIAAAGHGHVLADISDAGALAAKSSVDDGDWSGTALAVANGGTGLTAVTADRLLRGNGSGALQESGVTIDENDCLHGFKSMVATESGSSYSLQATDGGKVLETTNAGAVALTLPASFPKGFTVTVVQMGAGQVTFAPASGASLCNRSGHDKTVGQYAVCTLYVSSNSDGGSAVYVMAGDSA